MRKSGGMSDIGDKEVTVRTAKASGCIEIGKEAFEVVKGGASMKGDVLGTAKIAAIQAVKSTSAIIPMCHSVLIEAVDVDFIPGEQSRSVSVIVTVKSTGKTGVEMEALSGVAVACLTIYDMLKYIDKTMTIGQIKLLEKKGGKSGDYKRPD